VYFASFSNILFEYTREKPSLQPFEYGASFHIAVEAGYESKKENFIKADSLLNGRRFTVVTGIVFE